MTLPMPAGFFNSINTNNVIKTIEKYDKNGDGLSKKELAVAQREAYQKLSFMKRFGNNDMKEAAMKEYNELSKLVKNFETLSKAGSSGFMSFDNPNTISMLDVMKTASKDGNMSSISFFDLAAQKQENWINNNNWRNNFGPPQDLIKGDWLNNNSNKFDFYSDEGPPPIPKGFEQVLKLDDNSPWRNKG